MTRDQPGDTFAPHADPRTQAFLTDLEALYQKHHMALYPETGYHRGLQIVPLEPGDLTYIRRQTHFSPTLFGWKPPQ